MNRFPVRRPRRANPLRVIALAAGLLAAATPGAAAATIAERVQRAVARSGVSSTTSVVVYDVARQAIIYKHLADRSLTPASNQKLATAAALLERLGPHYRFQTRLALRGTQYGTRFVGNVYLIGGGDPSLSTRSFAKRNFGGAGGNLDLLTGPLRARGITRIEGRLVVDESFLDKQRYVSSWPWRYWYDEATALGGLTVNHSYLGRYLSGTSSRRPALRAGQVYRGLLRAHGIRFTQDIRVGLVPTNATEVGKVESPPLRVLVRFMNRHSDNFTAEILLKDLGRVRAGPGNGTTARGARIVRRRLDVLGVNVSPVSVADGSGLSTANRTTARTTADVLNVMDLHATLAWYFRASLAVSGGAGTLHDRLDTYPYKGRVIAKTGTLTASSALSGFSTRLSGTRYGFSVITYRSGGGGVDWTTSRRLQDRIAAILVS